ncbi:MAG: glycoside hydrolase family 3 N-terminal domain-containing protein, partial [Merdibacter sp.]|nr:glycoside hydrolase family 3 N-terminal domain-containing protein [Merdibacter sp.]
YDFGGVILFAENVKETEQTLKLTNDLQDAAIANEAGNGDIPLLITIDQEGGIVYRLGSGTALPGNMAIGATNSEEDARLAGEIIGRELSALGINVNFAPVFDTNNNPNNPVIGLRSISSDPQRVARLGVPMMQGMQEYNIATAAKHFPGHGDTATDSHTGLPLVDKSYEELKNLELIPFQAAVDNGVDMLMTAHIQYPQIEKDTVISKADGSEVYVPATLSDDIITGVVREDMGFDGVVVTDALNMDAISTNFGESEAVIMAIQADVDICLMPTILRSKEDMAKMDQIIADVKAALEDGTITEDMLNDSVKRILTLKEKRGILDYASDTRTWEEKLANANEQVGSDLNRDLEREISADAVTVVKNDDMVLPLNPKADEKVLLLGAYNNELPGMEIGMRRLISEGVLPENVQYESIRYNSSTTIDDLKSAIDSSDYVIVISEVGSASQLLMSSWLTRVPTEVVNYANETGKDSVVMSISKPYDVANYPDAKAVIAVYGNKGMDPTESLRPDAAYGPNIPAGIDVIFRGHEAEGELPVDVPVIVDHVMDTTQTAYPVGYGLDYNAPVSGIEVVLPESAKAGETFEAVVELKNLAGVENEAYDVQITYDSEKMSVVASDAYTVDGNVITVHKDADDVDPITISFKADQAAEDVAPITSISVLDSKDRTFTLGEGAYADQVMDITAAQTETPDQPDEPEKEPGQSDDADTGLNKDYTAMLSLMGASLTAGAVLLVIRRRRRA